MARGWESKAVELQIEGSTERRHRHLPDLLPEKSAGITAKVASLRLQRTRIIRDLEKALHPNHKATLQQALAHLDQELSSIET